MRVSAFLSDATLRQAGTGLRRTKSPGGAAFELCSNESAGTFGFGCSHDGVLLFRSSDWQAHSAGLRLDPVLRFDLVARQG
jgi:hypothetical protein